MFVFLIFALNVLRVYASDDAYMGHQVYNIKFENEKQANKFYLLKSDIVDFWRKPSFKYNVTGRAMVPPSHTQWFEQTLEELNIEKDIYIDDVYLYLREKEKSLKKYSSDDNSGFDYDQYHRYDTILDYMNKIHDQYINSPNINVTLVEAGKTDENRPIVYLEVSSTSNINAEKPVVIVEAGMIPREWITIPSALNIVNKLVNETYSSYLEGATWIIIPVLNPDGYEYTHTNLRLWMKSRSTTSNLGAICPGVNINRNFGIDWQFSDTSSSPCSHLYGGVEEFSEPETNVIRSLINEYGRRIRLYVSLQNSGNFISYPWQYEKAASGMFRQHYLLGLDMLTVMGDEYNIDVGSLALGDRASGTSSDYAMESGVLYTFNIDISGGDDGVLVPESEISTIADKVWRTVALAVSSITN